MKKKGLGGQKKKRGTSKNQWPSGFSSSNGYGLAKTKRGKRSDKSLRKTCYKEQDLCLTEKHCASEKKTEQPFEGKICKTNRSSGREKWSNKKLRYLKNDIRKCSRDPGDGNESCRLKKKFAELDGLQGLQRKSRRGEIGNRQEVIQERTWAESRNAKRICGKRHMTGTSSKS